MGVPSAYISPEGQSKAPEENMPIDLSQQEKDIVTGLLEKELEDIRSEFHHTQGHGYKAVSYTHLTLPTILRV